MADGKVTIDTELNDAGLNKGLSGLAGKASSAISGVAKAASVAAVAAGAAVVNLARQAVAGYGEYEQMVGGVQKLYGNMGKSLDEYAAMVGKSTTEVAGEWQALENAQNIVLENAKNAFREVGMSANQYMQIATSFSASLINSLGGDTVKAAQQTQKAMQAISDNWNTFGGDLSMIQSAFQGFAKQNYMMLDNLKLGYGGTKTEMERLIKDANEYAKTIGEASNLSIDSFSDIVDAIDLIQRKQNIAGTTAREAATTIQGSLNMTKAAWENLVTGLADKNADFDKLFNDLVSSLEITLDNILPVIEKALNSIVVLIERLAPLISARLPGLVQRIIPPLINAAGQIVNALIKALPGILQGIWDAVTQEGGAGVQGLIVTLMLASKKLTNDAFLLFRPVGKAISDAIEFGYNATGLKKKVNETITWILENHQRLGPMLRYTLSNAFFDANYTAGVWSRKIADTVGNALSAVPGKMVQIGSTIGGALARGLSAAAGGIGAAIKGIGVLFQNLGKFFTNPVGIIITAIALLVIAFITLYKNCEDFRNAVNGIGKALLDALKPVLEFFKGVYEQMKPVLDEIGKLISDRFSKFIETLMPAFQQIGQAFSDVLGAILPILSQLGSMFAETFSNLATELAPMFADLGKTFVDLFNQMAPIFQELGTLLSETLSQTVQQLAPVLGELAQTMGGVLLNAMMAIADILKVLLPAIAQIVTALLPVVAEVIGVLAGALAGILVVALEAVMQIIQVLVPLIADLISNLLPLIVPIIQMIADILNVIIPLIANIITAIMPLIIQLIQAILPLLIPVIQTIANLISAILPVITTLVTTILPPLINVISAILSVLTPIINFIAGVVITVIQTVVSIIQGICQVLTGDFQGAADTFGNLWNNIVGFVGNAMSNIGNAVGAGINAVISWFVGLPGRIMGALGNLGGILVDAGRSIMEGFLNGLKAAWGAVTDFVGGIADWIASHKGPKQKDLKLLVPAGKWIMQGFRNSLKKETQEIYKDIRKIGPTMSKELALTMQQHSLSIGNDITLKVENGQLMQQLENDLINSWAAIQTTLQLNAEIAQAKQSQAIDEGRLQPVTMNFPNTPSVPSAIYQKFNKEMTFGFAKPAYN